MQGIVEGMADDITACANGKPIVVLRILFVDSVPRSVGSLRRVFQEKTGRWVIYIFLFLLKKPQFGSS
jgi:hypothetical protein